ncbi:MAG: hypothetical protein ACYC36_06060 [Bellilinea sp.]
MKNPTSIRTSKLTASQLAALVSKTGMNQTEVISVAIDRMYNEEIGMKRISNKSYEVLGINPSELTGMSTEEIADLIRKVQSGLSISEPRMTEDEIQETAEKIHKDAALE